MNRFRFLLPSLLLAATLACGDLAEVDSSPPLAVVNGRLSEVQAVATTTPPRVAVLWVTHGVAAYMTTQDIVATPVFPSQFQIALTEPPPADVAISFERSSAPTLPGRISVGALVAYEDRNANAKLDLVDESDSEYIDRVLGTNASLYLAYLEGSAVPPELAAVDGSVPVPGYNLMRRRVCPMQLEPPDSSDPAATLEDCDPDVLAWLPMTELYDLPLSGDPELASVMCRRGENYLDSGPRAPLRPPPTPDDAPVGVFGTPYPPDLLPGPWPKAGDPLLACSPHGTALNYKWCEETSERLCRAPLLSCTTMLFNRPPDDLSADWPCPIR